MLGKGGSKVSERLITHEAAEAAFFERMDLFRDEVFEAFGENLPEPTNSLEELNIRVEQFYRDDCLRIFARVWKRKVNRGARLLEKAVLRQTKKQVYGPARVRTEKGKPVPKTAKKKSLGSGKKPHRKTGRPKGRPVAALFDPGSVTRRREAARKARAAQRKIHSALNIVREIRGWRKYPARRKPKVEGWMQQFRDGALTKGTRGKYQHAAKKAAQE